MVSKTALVVGLLAIACAWWVTRNTILALRPTHTFFDRYDYIVIGSGSAGSVVASRLAQANYTVLVLEAGSEDSNPAIHIPAGVLDALNNEGRNYSSTPQGTHNRAILLPRGNVLGGCSSVNAMIYMRGHKLDYDEWAKLTGDASWNYDNVLTFFKKSENNVRGESKYHGVGGPLNVDEPVSPHEVVKTMLEAAQQAGFEPNPDFNGEKQEGFGFVQVTQKGGERHSAADAFLKPTAAVYPNLHVRVLSRVTRIIFDEQKNAVAVEYVPVNATGHATGPPVVVKADKEIIVSAGAFESPHLLMLSGIGDSDELKKHGIQVVQHLPGVGKNLQDHLLLPVSVTVDLPITLQHEETVYNVLWYLATKSGPLSSNLAEATLFFKSTMWEGEAPDMQFHMAPFFGQEMHKDPPKNFFKGITILTGIVRPTSIGSMTLNNTDPAEQLIIDGNFLGTELDRNRMIEGVKIALKILQQPALKDVISATPVWSVPPNSTDDEIMDLIYKHFTTIYHPVGTCKMGKAEDTSAVVDSKLKVIGVGRLRVADASIMPTIVGGNTNAPSIMIGEKAAALILQDSKK